MSFSKLDLLIFKSHMFLFPIIESYEVPGMLSFYYDEIYVSRDTRGA